MSPFLLFFTAVALSGLKPMVCACSPGSMSSSCMLLEPPITEAILLPEAAVQYKGFGAAISAEKPAPTVTTASRGFTATQAGGAPLH